MRSLLLLLVLLATPAWAKKPPEPPPASWYVSDAHKADVSSANSLLAQKKYGEAATAYAAVLVDEPSCGVALLGLGRARLGEGKAPEAVDPLGKLTGLFADKVEGWVAYGQALHAAGRHPDAVEAAKKAIALKPTSVEAQWVAQQALVAQKDYAGAHTMLADARTKGWMVVLDCMDGLVYAAEGDRPHAEQMQATCRDFQPWSQQLADAVAALPAAASTAAPAPAAPAPSPAAPPPK